MVEEKIEEFLVHFGERLTRLSEEAFRTQVAALVQLKESEDAHLGEEVDRHWFEVVTQQYVFRRLEKEVSADRDQVSGTQAAPGPRGGVVGGFWRGSGGVVEGLWASRRFRCSLWFLQVEALRLLTREDLLTWFLEHRTGGRKLSVHVRAHVQAWPGGPAGIDLCLFGVSQVVGFGRKEDPPGEEGAPGPAGSAYGEVSQLTFLPARSPALQDATPITDIRAFTSSLDLHPYHKILS